MAACSSPELDEYIKSHYGRIDGTVFYPSGAARGNVAIFLFRSDSLPPPVGTASTSVNLVIVSEESLFHGVDPAAVQDFAAPFTIPTVPPGKYQIRAFLDAGHSFNPVFPYHFLAEPTAGDVLGGYLDRATAKFLDFDVEADKVTTQITVTLGFTTPVERPVFAITSTSSFQSPYYTPQLLTLSAHPIKRSLVKTDPQKTAFLIQWMLGDDGKPIDRDGDHLLDVYPEVLLRRIDPAPDANGTTLIPGIIDPYPYLDELNAKGYALTTRLDVLLPPVSVLHTAQGDTVSMGVPPGTYEVNVISGTGQTWTVPNPLDTVDPGDQPDPTQSAAVHITQGPLSSKGSIVGRLRIPDDKRGDAYVFAFDSANPPPPLGGGRPVSAASIPAAKFMPIGGGQLEAQFELPALADGIYVLRGLVDPMDSFSPFDDLVAQPQRFDVVGPAMPVAIPIAGGATVQNVEVDLTIPVLFDRPAFEMPDVSIPRNRFPASIELTSHPIDVLKMTAETAKVPIVLAPGDDDGDNLRDLYPRVVLTKMVDSPMDPRLAADDPSGLFIPGIVDPIPYLVSLARGAPAIPVSKYRVILPSAAVRIGPMGAREITSPPPAGRYRVNVLSATGQTWSLPSNLDVILRRRGGQLEDPTQARALTVTPSDVPMGAITGNIQIAVPLPDQFEVIVLAYAKANPPPPRGAGRPAGAAVVPQAAFQGTLGSYAIGNLPTGTYQVQAFLDANHDFVPWFDTMNQPDQGDVGGGALMLPQPVFRDITVDALGPPAAGTDVTIVSQLTIPTDRPVFGLPGGGPSWDGASPALVAVSTVSVDTDLIHQHGIFPVQWVDLDGDGMADDVTGDGQPDVFPLVVAELLDPMDATNRTPASPEVRILGIVDPRQFLPLGFPANDPRAVTAVVVSGVLRVVFPPVAIDASLHPLASVPKGKYRITLIDGTGQTWTVPNELEDAAATPLPMTQAGVLTVR